MRKIYKVIPGSKEHRTLFPGLVTINENLDYIWSWWFHSLSQYYVCGFKCSIIKVNHVIIYYYILVLMERNMKVIHIVLPSYYVWGVHWQIYWPIYSEKWINLKYLKLFFQCLMEVLTLHVHTIELTVNYLFKKTLNEVRP